jgi:hypothetical protein
VLDPRIPDGLTSIREGWCLDDIVHAHALLDECDAVDARAESAARDEARAKGRTP